ncbi:ESAT-6-like protein [Actinomycetota bacterium]|nr:ESAT-6-like protein [Actinomycetota bacterium]
MAGRIKLSPDELRTSAEKYSSGSEEIQQILSDLTQEQGVIRDNWEGSSFESFDEQFTELSPKIQQFAELLQDIREQLHSVAEIIEQTDADIAAQIRG